MDTSDEVSGDSNQLCSDVGYLSAVLTPVSVSEGVDDAGETPAVSVVGLDYAVVPHPAGQVPHTPHYLLNRHFSVGKYIF